jgi:putative transposon-encoded protein
MRGSKKVLTCDMVMEKATRVGNSSHIILPNTWLNKKVMVIKMEK